jgi:hypothetical protein
VKTGFKKGLFKFFIFAKNIRCFFAKKPIKGFLILKNFKNFYSSISYKTTKNAKRVFLHFYECCCSGYFCFFFVTPIWEWKNLLKFCLKLCFKNTKKFFTSISAILRFQRKKEKLHFFLFGFFLTFLMPCCQYHFIVAPLHSQINNNHKNLLT